MILELTEHNIFKDDKYVHINITLLSLNRIKTYFEKYLFPVHIIKKIEYNSIDVNVNLQNKYKQEYNLELEYTYLYIQRL